MVEYDILGGRINKRKTVGSGLRHRALANSKGRCQKCGKDIIGKGLKPRYHHKKPVSQGGTNTERNIAVLCNDCHDKVHTYETRVKRDMLGFATKKKVLVSKRIRKSPTKKKTSKPKRKQSDSILGDFDVFGSPRRKTRSSRNDILSPFGGTTIRKRKKKKDTGFWV